MTLSDEREKLYSMFRQLCPELNAEYVIDIIKEQDKEFIKKIKGERPMKYSMNEWIDFQAGENLI